MASCCLVKLNPKVSIVVALDNMLDLSFCVWGEDDLSDSAAVEGIILPSLSMRVVVEPPPFRLEATMVKRKVL